MPCLDWREYPADVKGKPDGTSGMITMIVGEPMAAGTVSRLPTPATSCTAVAEGTHGAVRVRFFIDDPRAGE
jgi:hypothetical protein